MKTDIFSAEEFFSPDNSCYPVYSWMWNEKLSKEEIKRQLDEMYDRNIRGVYVIPLPAKFRPTTMTTALTPDYLSDGYFGMLSFAAAYARSKGMTFWLYDEGGWPSGNAVGAVTERDRALRLTYIEKGKIRRSVRADLTNSRATEKFIRLTHERHKEKMGEAFYALGPLVFTDEPSVGALPFSKSVRKEFKRRTGKRLSPRKLSKHDCPEFNIAYHDICADLFAENYFRPIKQWCNRNGLLSAGHLDKDHETLGFRKGYHHPLRQLRLLDVAGVDVIWGQITPEGDCGFFPRLASSAAEQSGSGLSLTESLSVYGSLTYEQMRYILGYQLVRGISILNFMLIMYDENGYYALRQRPCFSRKLPSAEFLPEFNRYMACLQYLMRTGRPDTRCALYLPIRSLWADDGDTERALSAYEKTGREIERHHGQFDIIDDDLILSCDEERLSEGIIAMGRGEYRTVYIPADKYMPEKVKSRLRRFLSGGGRIYLSDKAEYFPSLRITGDEGQLRVHKRKYDGGELYLLFNEGTDRITAEIDFPDGTAELDALNQKIYSPSELCTFESGEIRVFMTSRDTPAAVKAPMKGRKITDITEFKIRQTEAFTLDKDGMSRNSSDGTEQSTGCGDWSAVCAEAFSGKCEYRANFTLDEIQDIILSLGKICYACEVFLNGVKISDIFMSPYETAVDKALLRRDNELIIAVSNTAANAFVHFTPPAEWEKKHIGPYHERALEFEKRLIPSGLFGPVEIFEKENSDE